jgi:hypothetical protein
LIDPIVGMGIVETDTLSVMAGLVPAIHVFDAGRQQGVDARHKAGHDEQGPA